MPASRPPRRTLAASVQLLAVHVQHYFYFFVCHIPASSFRTVIVDPRACLASLPSQLFPLLLITPAYQSAQNRIQSYCSAYFLHPAPAYQSTVSVRQLSILISFNLQLKTSAILFCFKAI
jgi:hypothetical protein